MPPTLSSPLVRRLVVAVSGAVAVSVIALPALTPTGLTQLASAAVRPAVPTARPAVSAPLRVARYNIRCATCFEGRTNEKPWADRRATVVGTIKRQHLDVLAVKEASQGLLHDPESEPRRISQIDDLVARLGGTGRITNATREQLCQGHLAEPLHVCRQGRERGPADPGGLGARPARRPGVHAAAGTQGQGRHLPGLGRAAAGHHRRTVHVLRPARGPQ